MVSVEAFNAIIRADYVFGCLDCEGARLILNELCAAYVRPYWDLAVRAGGVRNSGRHAPYSAWDREI